MFVVALDEFADGLEAGDGLEDACCWVSAMKALREFMFEHVYLGPAARAEHEKIGGVVKRLFEHYVEHPELLPPTPSGAAGGDEDLARRVTDYLAGMTDRYCIREFTELEVPQAFAR